MSNLPKHCQSGSNKKDCVCGCCTAAIVGQILGIVGWLVESQIEFGSITVDTLQEVGPALTGQPCKQGLITSQHV